MKHPDFHKCDPMRRQDWRLQRALALLEGGQTPRRPGRWDDRQVRGFYKFLRILREADPAAVAEVEGRAGRRIDAAALEKYFANRAGIWYAFRIYAHQDREWRWLVQAALLAREDDAHIAQRLGTLPDAICWYHDLFFDVRDRLDARWWISRIIRGPWTLGRSHPDGSPTEYQQGVQLMQFAYSGGSLILDALVSGFPQFESSPGNNRVAGWFDRSLHRILPSKCAGALAMLEPNKSNALQLVKHCLRSAGSAGGGSQEPSDLEIGVEAFLREFPPELLPRKPKSH